MRKLLLAMIIGVSLVAVGCSKDKAPTAKEDSSPKTEAVSTDTTVTSDKVFTLDELSKFNGQNGNPAYVAVKGKVYDVSKIKAWKNGKHKQGIVAGKDLTNEITTAPHGEDVLKDLPVVGTLSK